MKLTFTIVFSIFSLALFAQTRQIAGSIINKKTGEGIPSAEISFTNPANIETVYTSNDGKFQVENFPETESLCIIRVEHNEFKVESANRIVNQNGTILPIELTPKNETVGIRLNIFDEKNNLINARYDILGIDDKINIAIQGRDFCKIENEDIGTKVTLHVFTNDSKYKDHTETFIIKSYHYREIILKKNVENQLNDTEDKLPLIELYPVGHFQPNPNIPVLPGSDTSYPLTQKQKNAIEKTKIIMQDIIIAEYETNRDDLTNILTIVNSNLIFALMYNEAKIYYLSIKIEKQEAELQNLLSAFQVFIQNTQQIPSNATNTNKKNKFDIDKAIIVSKLDLLIVYYEDGIKACENVINSELVNNKKYSRYTKTYRFHKQSFVNYKKDKIKFKSAISTNYTYNQIFNN